MNVYVLKNDYFKSEEDLPVLGTQYSTGYDIKSVSEPEIKGELHSVIEGTAYYKSIDYIQYRTGLFVNLDPEESRHDALIFPRSSISKYNLQLANSIGLCDVDYTGEYLVRFNYLFQPEDLIVMDGCIYGKINYNKIYKLQDKICQLKFSNVIHPKFILTNELMKTERGSGGFGSTDEKKSNPIEEHYRYVQNVSAAYFDQKNAFSNDCNINNLYAKYADTYNINTSTKYSDMIDKVINNQQKGSNE